MHGAEKQPAAPQISLSRDFARALDPVLLARDVGIEPDPIQCQLLSSTSRKVLILATRQWGKSTTTALIALHEAVYRAPAMIVLVSPSQTQSTELFKKIHGYWEKLEGAPNAEQESLTRLQLSNGSRIISLPGSEKTVRGYSGATLVIIDEAARVPDEMLQAVTPMLATTSGRLLALSTPRGKRGWLYEAWTQGGDSWERISVKAQDCPRISKEFLADELAALGPMRFSEEYECAWVDSDSSAFSSALIEAALVGDDEFAVF